MVQIIEEPGCITRKERETRRRRVHCRADRNLQVLGLDVVIVLSSLNLAGTSVAATTRMFAMRRWGFGAAREAAREHAMIVLWDDYGERNGVRRDPERGWSRLDVPTASRRVASVVAVLEALEVEWVSKRPSGSISAPIEWICRVY